MDAEALTHALGGVWRREYGTARCPAHDDHSPSLTIRQGKNGAPLVWCQTGCTQDAVIGALRDSGLWDGKASSPPTRKPRDDWQPVTPVPNDAPKLAPDHPRLGTPSARWPYRDAEGCLLFVVCRFDTPDGKEILPRSLWRGPRGQLNWRWKALPPPRRLYGLHGLAQRPDAPVLVVEGEKTAAAAAELFTDHVVTTWPGGCESVGKADWSPLRGREMTVWPDADAPGAKAAQVVARACRDAGAAGVWIVPLPPDTPDKWDVADPLPEEWTADTLRTLLDGAKRCEAAKSDGWPDPSVLDGGLPAPTLPVEVFGPFWSSWIGNHAKQASVPPDFVAAPLLGFSAAAIGNARAASPWDGWQEPSILWFAKIGTPSSGKTPSDQPVLDLVARLERELAAGYDQTLRQYETDALAAKAARETWEKEVRAATGEGQPPPIMPDGAVAPEKPARPRLKTSDATTEAMGALLASHPKGLAFHRDELSGWLGNFDRYGGGGDRAFWSECYNGGSYAIDRMKHPEPIRIQHLSVSVVGGIQPDRLASLLLSGDDDGLPARFLMVWPEPIPPTRPTVTINNDLAYEAFRRLHRLEMGIGEDDEPTRVKLPFSDEAADLLQQFRAEQFERQPTGGMISSHYGKLPGAVVRLALVLEHLWWAVEGGEPPRRITAKAVTGAAALVSDYFLPMARRAYGNAALPEDERGARTIARWIVRDGAKTLNASELRRTAKLPGLQKAGPVRAALDFLEDAGWIRAAPAREGATKGRKRSDYIVNSGVRGLAP